ncbi:MAG: hypothetical protein ACYTEL_24305 [Planctomycetota bacterium]
MTDDGTQTTVAKDGVAIGRWHHPQSRHAGIEAATLGRDMFGIVFEL